MRTAQPAVVELRPGVFRPDCSVVKSPAAREALGSPAKTRPGLIDKWLRGLTPDEDRVWRAVLELYAALGRPPGIPEISQHAKLPEGTLPGLLQQLEDRDLLARGPDGIIRHAYPLSEATTGHRVTVRGRALNTLCAIDALGTGAMYRTDVSIQSACALCDNAIHVATSDAGRTLAEVSPPSAVVWYDFAYSDSAAASCCPAIAFFCQDHHLRRWLDAQTPRRHGMPLSMRAVLELGRAVFGPVLLPPPGRNSGNRRRKFTSSVSHSS